MIRVRSFQDLGAGIVFILIGLAGIVFGRDLAVGTAMRMGPGYFPMLLCALLILIGLVLGARSLMVAGPAVEPFHFRPLLLILALISASGYLLEWIGLALTTVVVTVGSAYARRDVSLRETLLLGAALALFVVFVFVYGLRQPLPAWWGR